MEFRDLKKQYSALKDKINTEINKVILECNFISGTQVKELEKQLAEYVGVKHCITCGNGTDALTLALMAWNIGPGDAVFVPDFTFFASGEVVSLEGATPIFVDVCDDTFNISCDSLELAIQNVILEGKLLPKVVISVDLFGQPANYPKLKEIAKKYNLLILEDAAQGFGGKIGDKKAGSLGDIATTSFFPSKPLGCYGDGGAIFTNDDNVAKLIQSLHIHGKGNDKYDNIRIGMNSRLDTIQCAILKVKLEALMEYELVDINKVADYYTVHLQNIVKTPVIVENYYSSWAQYSILLKNNTERNGLQAFLKEKGIPTMIYYPKSMHKQGAFKDVTNTYTDLSVTDMLCDCILSLPIHPYMSKQDIELVIDSIKQYLE